MYMYCRRLWQVRDPSPCSVGGLGTCSTPPENLNSIYDIKAIWCHFQHSAFEKNNLYWLVYTAQGSPFRCEKLLVISGSPEHNSVQKLHYTNNHYTNTANDINRKLCTNKRSKSCVNRKYHNDSLLKRVQPW